MTIVGLQP